MISASAILWALLCVIPLSGAGLLAGAALERAGVAPAVRERVWSLAYWLGPAACGLALAADALPRTAATEITVILRGTPLDALAQAARAAARTPLVHLPRLPDLILAAIALGAALRLVQLVRAWLALRTLRGESVAAPAAMVGAVRAGGLKASVPVRISARAPTPVAVGLLRPEILLPERFAAPEAAAAAAMVCRHEARHIARLDNLRLLLEQLAGAVLWFDPLRSAVHRRLLSAREERCDAAALLRCTPAERRLYAHTLLEELTQPVSPLLAAGLIGAGRSHAMARISAVIGPKPASRRPMMTLGLCACLACAGGGVGYATSQAGQPAQGWAGKAISSMTAIRLAQPRAAEPTLAEKGRAGVARWRPVKATATPATAAPGAPRPDLSDGMVVFVNGDMDVDDLYRLAVAHGGQVTDMTPELQQAVLRSAADEPRIDVMADNAEKFDGATRFSGDVEITGDLKRAFGQASVLVDYQMLTKDKIPSSRIVADSVEFKRIRGVYEAGSFMSVSLHGVHVIQ